MDLLEVSVLEWTQTESHNCFCHFHHRRSRRRRQEHQHHQQQQHCTNSTSHMGCSNFKISPIIPILVFFLSLTSPVFSARRSPDSGDRDHNQTHQIFRPGEEVQRLNMIRAHLNKINKPPVKTIHSPDGDLIDCVESHRQIAFDHPQLKGQKPLDPPERPRGHKQNGKVSENFQLWSFNGESCPEGTVPVRRTKEMDVLRASSIRRFGRKISKPIRRDSASNGAHEGCGRVGWEGFLKNCGTAEVLSSNFEEKQWLPIDIICCEPGNQDFLILHAVGYVTGEQYYGAKGSINVWAPLVTEPYEFSLSQMWVISGSFGDDLNTIEAGWQVSPELYGDNYPRFFTYWTSDAYQATGCYNLLCSGFVQTNNKIAIGAAISPTSSYEGGQFDISLLVWKDPKHGNWWLEFGSGVLVGYWPSFLFTHLRASPTEGLNSVLDQIWSKMGKKTAPTEGANGGQWPRTSILRSKLRTTVHWTKLKKLNFNQI